MIRKIIFLLMGNLPKPFTNNVLKVKGLCEYKVVKINKKKIYDYYTSNNKDRWFKILLELNKYGKRYSEFIESFLECNIFLESSMKKCNKGPVVICVVKNDLLRIKMLIKYYRSKGIENFAILDDNSTDGTLEYLVKQEDVTVFHSNKSYTTTIRQVWINKIITIFGLNRWYLIIDSDELFDYPNSEQLSIDDYIKILENNNILCTKSLLLDMFSPNSFYSENINNEDDIRKEYCLFSNNYSIEGTFTDYRIRGGGREKLFLDKDRSPIVSKYPLLYVCDDTVIINSHYNYPFKNNNPKYPNTVLLHYKFLQSDKKKYEERIRLGNFHNNSIDYKTYLNAGNSIEYASFIKDMYEYKNFESLKIIDVFIGE